MQLNNLQKVRSQFQLDFYTTICKPWESLVIPFYWYWNPLVFLYLCTDCLKLSHLQFGSLIMIQISLFLHFPIIQIALFWQNIDQSIKNLHQLQLKAFSYQFLTQIKHAKSCLQKIFKFETFQQIILFIFSWNPWKSLKIQGDLDVWVMCKDLSLQAIGDKRIGKK